MSLTRRATLARRMGCARGPKWMACLVAGAILILVVVYHAIEYSTRKEECEKAEKRLAENAESPIQQFTAQTTGLDSGVRSSDGFGIKASSVNFKSATASTSYEMTAENDTESNFNRLLKTLQTKRFLPNFFLHGRPRGTEGEYSRGHIVFVHNVKAGGTSVKHVLTRLAREYRMPMVRLFDANSTRNATDKLSSAAADVTNATNISQMAIMGGCSFGVCDVLGTGEEIPGPCSYITMIRHPVDRIISMFLFCRQPDHPCSDCDIPGDGVTLEDWAVERGSHFFRQLTAVPAFCEIQRSLQNTTQRRAVLNLVLNNLANWFSAIGITEEFDASLRMFETVYQLPFTKMLDHPLNEGKLKNEMDDEQINEMREELLSNPIVMNALHEDLMIYERAKEIFELQKIVA